MKVYNNIFDDTISVENLFLSWKEFKKGKTNKQETLEFELNLEQNIFQLHKELKTQTYKHGSYKTFKISDPKPREINKASVKDRIVHHTVCNILIKAFESIFISNSFSCRKNKGTHKGVYKLEELLRKVSKNNTNSCFVLKCDIKKFFENIDHDILLSILFKRIQDKEFQWLLYTVIDSFKKGIPLGNVTSQWFANIYLNELDQYLERELKVKNYVRYTDDFLIISSGKEELKKYLNNILNFLIDKLKIKLHSNKVIIKKYIQGIDFLGYITLPHYRLIRTKTKKRILKRINKKNYPSYMGVLSHANSYNFLKTLKSKPIL